MEFKSLHRVVALATRVPEISRTTGVSPHAIHKAQAPEMNLSVFCSSLRRSAPWRFCGARKAVTVATVRIGMIATQASDFAVCMLVAKYVAGFDTK
jgi:hypothetical protein